MYEIKNSLAEIKSVFTKLVIRKEFLTFHSFNADGHIFFYE